MPRTLLPDARRSPRFAGPVTFGRYPRIEDAVRDNRPIDWAVYGVPFDGGVTYRPGARFGPRAIRAESQYLKRYSIEHDVDVPDVLSIADAGDAPVAPFSCQTNTKIVSAFAAHLQGAPGQRPDQIRLLALGGDHSTAFSNIRATWERQGKPKNGLAVIHFDSHLDTVDAVWGEEWSHASVFRRAIEEKLIDPRAMISMGVKGPLNSADDIRYARQHGVTVLTYRQFLMHGRSSAEEFVRRLRGRPTYLSFDIDCIDPAFAPGTGTPSPGGFTSGEALDAVRLFAGANIVGADVVEVLPDRDPQGSTALLAAHIAFEILCLDAIRRPGPAPAPRRPRRAARPRRKVKRGARRG